MRKAVLLTTFFFATPFLLIFSILFLSLLAFQQHKAPSSFSFFAPTPPVAFAALPSTNNTFQETIEQEDARVETIRQFFAKYKSPLEPFAEHLVREADTYGLDFRLLPAIAMQESNLCRRVPQDSHNCWGFGIYGQKVKRFENYETAITAVTKTLAKDYYQKGLQTPEQIMTKYTPSSNGSWAASVNHFMEQLQ